MRCWPKQAQLSADRECTPRTTRTHRCLAVFLRGAHLGVGRGEVEGDECKVDGRIKSGSHNLQVTIGGQQMIRITRGNMLYFLSQNDGSAEGVGRGNMGPTHPIEVGLKRRLVRVHEDLDRLSCEHRAKRQFGVREMVLSCHFPTVAVETGEQRNWPRQKLSYPDGQPANHVVSLGASR